MEFMDLEDLVPDDITGLCGIATPFVAYIMIAISILTHSWFTWADNALSDLGAVGTSQAYIFNAGLIVAGILGIIFTFGLFQYAEDILGQIGSFIFLAAMVLLILIGVFPSGTFPHMYVAIGFFAAAAAGIVFYSLDQMWDMEPTWGVFPISSVILISIGVWLVYTIPYDLGYAIPEFLGTIPIMQFSLVFGTRIYFEF